MERAINEAKRELLRWERLLKKLKGVKEEFFRLKNEVGMGEVVIRRWKK